MGTSAVTLETKGHKCSDIGSQGAQVQWSWKPRGTSAMTLEAKGHKYIKFAAQVQIVLEAKGHKCKMTFFM